MNLICLVQGKVTDEASHLVEAKTVMNLIGFVQGNATNEASHLVEARTVNEFNWSSAR